MNLNPQRCVVWCSVCSEVLFCWFSQVYDHELESVKEFMGLTDFCSTFKLQRGKNESDDDDPAVVGEFKARCLINLL